MEITLPILLTLATVTVVVTVDNSATNHYLRCLHESQCEKVLEGTYCCPTGTCCHFYMKDSKKVMSRCKRIRPDLTLYCQDGDKHILNDKDLQDSRFYDTPPNKGKVCITRHDGSVFCFGGTDSEEEEFKAKGTAMTITDGVHALQGFFSDFKTDIKGFDGRKMFDHVTTKSRDCVFGIKCLLGGEN